MAELGREASLIGRSKYFWVVLVPALIAGLFAFLPTLYQEWKQPRASLTFDATVGPEVKATDGIFRIGSVQITNTGTKPLSGVRAFIEAPGGSVQAFNVADAQLINARIETANGSVAVDVNTLLPTEKFTASYLIKSASMPLIPRVRVRSNEVVGQIQPLQKEPSKILSGLSSALSAGLAVLTTLILLIRGKGITSVISKPLDKQTFIRYVAIRSGVSDFAVRPDVVGQSLTYLQASDVLLAIALLDPKQRTSCAFACEALLLVSDMADSSRKLITRNVEKILGAESFQKEADMLKSKAIDSSKGVALRALVDDFLDDPVLFMMDLVLRNAPISQRSGAN